MLIYLGLSRARLIKLILMILLIITASSAGTLLLFLKRPESPIRFGFSERLAPIATEVAGPSTDVQFYPVSSDLDPQDLLRTGQLDVYLANNDLTGWDRRYVGSLVGAVVVNFFHPLQELSLSELRRRLAEEPDTVLVSYKLSAVNLPWPASFANFLPTSQVLQAVAADRSLLGIIPVQERIPSVRVLPVDGRDPRRPEIQETDYPLIAPLVLHCRRPNLLDRLRQIVQRSQPAEDFVETLSSDRNMYWNPWKGQTNLVAVGDIMLDRDVKKEGLRSGWEQILSNPAPFLSKVDLAFANLESPIGSAGHFINMFQAPPEAINTLTFAGIDVVSLANNHALDYHHEGLLETMRILKENGIVGVGAGRNIGEARQPVILMINGVRIGFAAFTEMWFVHAREPISWAATPDEPGVVPAEPRYVTEDIAQLRQQADVVVASFHWGQEYKSMPTNAQKELARRAIDAGADLVLGHHPHVLQGIEFYKQGVIAYSLGNFVFDLNLPATWETMLLEVTFSANGLLDLSIHPAYIYGVKPRLLAGGQRQALLQRIRHLSLSLE